MFAWSPVLHFKNRNVKIPALIYNEMQKANLIYGSCNQYFSLVLLTLSVISYQGSAHLNNSIYQCFLPISMNLNSSKAVQKVRGRLETFPNKF